MTRCLLAMMLFAGLCGCGAEKEERRPTAQELQNYTGAIDKAEEVARAEAIESSRAKEDAVEKAHTNRLRAQE